MADLRLTENQDSNRFELHADGEVVGFAEYRPAGDAVMLTHTEVGSEHEGKGYGSALAKAVLDEIRSRGQSVVPLCPFISSYIRRHGEYLDLVREDRRAAFHL